MSSTNIVRSAIEGSRRNSRSLGNMSAVQTTMDPCNTSVNVDSFLYGGSTLIPRKKKSLSEDDEEEDDLGTADLPQKPPRKLVSPLTSEHEDKRTKNDDGKNGRKTSVAAQEIYASLSKAEGDSSEEDAHNEDVINPWYFRSFMHVVDWSVDPDGFFYFYWKAILTLTVMYNYVVIVLRVAFEEMKHEPIFFLLDHVFDIIYLIDFLVESKTCYLSNGCLVYDPRLMFQNYLNKEIFVYDVIAVIPMQILFTTATGLCNMLGFPLSSILDNFHRIQPALRLNRLAKSHIMNSFFYKTESRTNNPNLLRALRLSIQLALVIHWIACLYYMMSEYEGLGANDWTYPSGAEYKRFQRKYIICLYWSIMTLTTIGERPSPVSDLEYVFTGLTFLIGVFVFAAVVGNVGDVISNMNAARRDFQTRMDQIKFYLNHRQVPDVLQTRIKRWAEYTWDRTKAVDEPSVLQWLPDRLRTEVAIYIHLNVLKKVSIFDECEEGLLRELVLKLKPQIFSPGDYICRIGEIGREMYIINHGKVEILFPDAETGAMRQVAVMNPGNFFGEISLLKLDDGQNKRTADVRSVGFSELLCLSRRDLMVALTEYPEAKRILEEYARERFQQTKKQARSQEGSADNSPRESVTSIHSPTSARQVFARVLRKEGFASLLKRKDTDLMAIKTAVDELKAAKSTEIHQTFILLQKEIQEMNKALLQRELDMQEAKAEIAYLKSIIMSHNLNLGKVKNGTKDEIKNTGDEMAMNSNSYLLHRNDVTTATSNSETSSPNSVVDDQRFRNQFYSENDTSGTNSKNSKSLDQPCMSNMELHLDQSLDKSIDIDSSFNSSEEDSCDELETIEKKFEKIGRDGIYASSDRSLSSYTVRKFCNQPQSQDCKFLNRRKSDNLSNIRLNSAEANFSHHKSMDCLSKGDQL